MQVGRGLLLSMILAGALLLGCGVYRRRMYEFPVEGVDRALLAYRIPTGPFARRFELRLESKNGSTLVHSREGEWYHVTCAAVVTSPDKRILSYIIPLWAPRAILGAYDLTNEKPLGDERIDREGLRHEIDRLYRGLPGFPSNARIDLLEWAQDIDSCQEAFHARFGYEGN